MHGIMISLPDVMSYDSYSKTSPVLSGHSKIDKTKILMATGSSMKVESIAECSKGSILQYFWPALSDNLSWKLIFGLLFQWPLKTGFNVYDDSVVGAKTQVKVH